MSGARTGYFGPVDPYDPVAMDRTLMSPSNRLDLTVVVAASRGVPMHPSLPAACLIDPALWPLPAAHLPDQSHKRPEKSKGGFSIHSAEFLYCEKGAMGLPTPADRVATFLSCNLPSMHFKMIGMVNGRSDSIIIFYQNPEELPLD
ncbi:MAG: hypothetical protein O2794_02825 [bacterium]|nr:hypothetical protein [bacterium]